MKSSENNVTLRDVAEKAHVSVATASRALSGRGYASSETKEKVLRAAKELGYKPNAAARQLKLNRTNTMGLIIADITNPFYSYLADGVLDCAKRLDYHVILCATDEDSILEQEYLEVLMEERVDGIVAVPTGNNVDLWRQAIDLGVKLVLADREVDSIPDADFVLVDNYKGAYEATDYLISSGHERIGILSGPTSTTTGQGRLQGYYAAHEDARLQIDENLVHIGTFKRESGAQGAHRLLSLDSPPSAVFAANNVLGETMMLAVRERGLQVPEDLSLIMFDDVPWASLTSPKITVVAQPAYSLGFTAMQRLSQRLEEADDETEVRRKTVLQPELIIRGSCVPYSK